MQICQSETTSRTVSFVHYKVEMVFMVKRKVLEEQTRSAERCDATVFRIVKAFLRAFLSYYFFGFCFSQFVPAPLNDNYQKIK